MRRGWGLVALLLATPQLVAAGKAPEPAGRWGISFDDYPSEALREKLQGTTRYTIAVDEASKATTCTIIKSSGYDVLDQRSCTVLMPRAKFKPAQDDAGNPVPGTWRHLVVWTSSNAPSARPNRPGNAGFGVTVSFDGNGEVSACKVEPLSMISQLTPG